MAVRLLLPIVLAAVLFHPDAAVQGKKAAAWREGIAPYHRCGACDTIRREIAKRQRALSPANKVLAIGDIIGTAENVCRPRKEEADWMLRIHVARTKDYGWEPVVKDEEARCDNEECKAIESAFFKVMEHDNDLVNFILTNKPSIEKLMNILCEEGIPSVPTSAEGEDNRLSKWIKEYGGKLKAASSWFIKKFRQITEKPTTPCENIEALIGKLVSVN